MRDYPGYPEIVVIAFPKCGTKTLNKCFTSLGYKVFDVQQVINRNFLSVNQFQLAAFDKVFDDYGKGKIEFAELAKAVWESNKYDVIIKPAGLFWKEMSDHWPKAKLINMVREVESWKASLKGMMQQVRASKDHLFHKL